jgi:hypothetical protein
MKFPELQSELLLLVKPGINLEERKTLYPEDCIGLNTVINRMHHFKCNPTTIMCYGTKMKSEACPPLCNTLSQYPP